MNTYVTIHNLWLKAFFNLAALKLLIPDIASDIHADSNDDNIDNDETENSEDLDTCDKGDGSSINQSAYLAQYYAREDVIELLSVDFQHL